MTFLFTLTISCICLEEFYWVSLLISLVWNRNGFSRNCPFYVKLELPAWQFLWNQWPFVTNFFMGLDQLPLLLQSPLGCNDSWIQVIMISVIAVDVPFSALLAGSCFNFELTVHYLSNLAPFFNISVLFQQSKDCILVFGPNFPFWHQNCWYD